MEIQIVMSDKTKIKKELIMNSALKHFNKTGYHITRIEDIIRGAGVGKGTFYLYFKNKEDVVLAILEEFLCEIESTLDWVQLNIENVESLRKLFLEEASKLTKTFINNQEAARFLFREGRAVSHDVEFKINNHIDQVIKASEETYQFALSIGILTNVNPAVSAMAVVGGISQIYFQWLEGQIQEDINVVIESTVDFYLSALGLSETFSHERK
ncbi:MAG: TetR/AcrR family transcriptional regulator [Bacteriovoracaceae bacterium]|jgi:AcrR family transcriptional regulator|nr:TetR/AcrR family transcriptional regulator [Bacteriovoracaceae bacterium]